MSNMWISIGPIGFICVARNQDSAYIEKVDAGARFRLFKKYLGFP